MRARESNLEDLAQTDQCQLQNKGFFFFNQKRSKTKQNPTFYTVYCRLKRLYREKSSIRLLLVPPRNSREMMGTLKVESAGPLAHRWDYRRRLSGAHSEDFKIDV